MGWETRNGTAARYYTRSKRRGDKVIREYVGGGGGLGGKLGQLAAQWDELERLEAEGKELEERAKWERVIGAAGFLVELGEAAEILTTAHLVTAGVRKRKGEWRFKRT